MIITRHINIVPFEIIPKAHFENAYQLAKDIDQDGTEFIALADFLNAKLWTGDKKLISGLINKGWDSGISTEEMIELY